MFHYDVLYFTSLHKARYFILEVSHHLGFSQGKLYVFCAKCSLRIPVTVPSAGKA